jgi:hypothetical protein
MRHTCSLSKASAHHCSRQRPSLEFVTRRRTVASRSDRSTDPILHLTRCAQLAIKNGSAPLVRVVAVASAAPPAFPVLPLWLPLESLELLVWTVFGGPTFGGAADAATCAVTCAVADAPGNVPSPRVGESDSPIGRENEGGRRSPPREATAAAVAAARRACVPRAQSRFAKGLLEGGGGGGIEEGSASTAAAAARALPGNKQVEPTEASHACGDERVEWGAWGA